MTIPNEKLPSFKTSKSLGQLIKDLNTWTGGGTDTTFKMMIAAWIESEDSKDMPADLRSKAEGFLARTTPARSWYVYEHREKTTGEVRYVGKGRRARAWSSQRTDPEHTHRMQQKEFTITFDEFDNEKDALAEESNRIQRYMKAGARLYNRHVPSEA